MTNSPYSHYQARATVVVTCFILLLACAPGCNDDPSHTANMEEYLPRSSDSLGGRAPFVVFDYESYESERRQLIANSAELFPRPYYAESCEEVLDRWEKRGSPREYWAAVHRHIGISRVYLTHEIGSADEHHYACYAIVGSLDEYYRVSPSYYHPGDVAAVEITQNEVRGLLNRVTKGIGSIADSTRVAGNFNDEGWEFLFVYGPDSTMTYLGNHTRHSDNPQIDSLFAYLVEVFERKVL